MAKGAGLARGFFEDVCTLEHSHTGRRDHGEEEVRQRAGGGHNGSTEPAIDPFSEALRTKWHRAGPADERNAAHEDTDRWNDDRPPRIDVGLGVEREPPGLLCGRIPQPIGGERVGKFVNGERQDHRNERQHEPASEIGEIHASTVPHCNSPRTFQVNPLGGSGTYGSVGAVAPRGPTQWWHETRCGGAPTGYDWSLNS